MEGGGERRCTYNHYLEQVRQKVHFTDPSFSFIWMHLADLTYLDLSSVKFISSLQTILKCFLFNLQVIFSLLPKKKIPVYVWLDGGR
jgi:hypothetical protein